MEIERKFTLKSLPDNLESYPSHHIEQVYLNYNPVIRARKQDDEYYLTYKDRFETVREELSACGTQYPAMKLMDMCMWQAAFEMDNE